MATTQLQPGGWGGQNYGSFAGKEAGVGSPDGPHNPGTITQLQLVGIGGGRYGSFAGKEASTEIVVPPAEQPRGGGLVLWGESSLRRHPKKYVRKAIEELLRENLPEAVEQIQESGNAKQVAAVNRVIAKHEVDDAVDWQELAATVRDFNKVVALWREVQRRVEEEQDEEEVLLLMMLN